MKTNRFLQLVGKERLMLSFRESEIVRYVVDEIVAERMQALEAERAKQEAERDKQEAERDKQEAELWARYEAEKEQLHATLEARKQEATMRELQQTLMEALIARFPQAPLALIQDIWRVTRPEHLRSLFVAVVKSPDLDAFERVLKQTAAEEDETRPG
jgi:hypothetical protein